VTGDANERVPAPHQLQLAHTAFWVAAGTAHRERARELQPRLARGILRWDRDRTQQPAQRVVRDLERVPALLLAFLAVHDLLAARSGRGRPRRGARAPERQDRLIRAADSALVRARGPRGGRARRADAHRPERRRRRHPTRGRRGVRAGPCS
jgi:hypothetical protein